MFFSEGDVVALPGEGKMGENPEESQEENRRENLSATDEEETNVRD